LEEANTNLLVHNYYLQTERMKERQTEPFSELIIDSSQRSAGTLVQESAAVNREELRIILFALSPAGNEKP